MDAILDALVGWGASLLQTEVTKMTTAFMIAAYLHRRWVRKDISEQINKLTVAIESLGKSMSEGFNQQTKRIDELDRRVNNLEDKGG